MIEKAKKNICKNIRDKNEKLELQTSKNRETIKHKSPPPFGTENKTYFRASNNETALRTKPYIYTSFPYFKFRMSQELHIPNPHQKSRGPISDVPG